MTMRERFAKGCKTVMQAGGLHLWLGIVWGMLGGVLGATAVAWASPDLPAIATVDLQRLVEGSRADMVKLATDQSLDEAGMARIEAQLHQFGTRLDEAVKTVAQRNGMVIIQSQAIAAGRVPDVTAEVARLLREEERP